MRVIYESVPTRMTLKDPRSGQEFQGYGFLRVYMYLPGEQPPLLPGTDKPIVKPRPLSELRAEAGPGKPIVAVPKTEFRDYIEPIAIPESVLSQVPDDARIEWRWRFE